MIAGLLWPHSSSFIFHFQVVRNWHVISVQSSLLKCLTFILFVKLLNVNILDPSILINGAGLGDHARSLHDSVALSEVSPPHMLVGDLYDVSHGEPALLTVW